MDKNIKDIVTMASLILGTYATHSEVSKAVLMAVAMLETSRNVSTLDALDAYEALIQRKSGVEDAA